MTDVPSGTWSSFVCRSQSLFSHSESNASPTHEQALTTAICGDHRVESGEMAQQEVALAMAGIVKALTRVMQ